jgi:pimeloyl-ACP methyl ester carboxylesterase
MRKHLLLLMLLTFLTPIAFAQTRIPKGEIADPVQSAYDPNQTHAIYVPSAYTPDKKWPILFCYDPRGKGRVPVELFREGAERLGWIIFSSNHSRSDDPHYSNLPVLNAMWNDAHRWFSIDERRIYATGFSGGARLAWGMGYIYPKSTAGVIGVGAGIHNERPPSKDTTFVWYGMCGKLDFNYLEIRRLDDQLHSLGIPSRTDFYEGPHSWPPDGSYCSHAMDWMELQAMKRDRRAKDPAWLQQQYDSRLEEAKKIASSSPLDGFLKYKEIQEDFDGLLNITDVSKTVAALAASDEVKKAIEDRKNREESELKYQKKYIQSLAGLRNGSDKATYRTLKSDLDIVKLQKEIQENGNNPDGMMYQRLLQSIYVELSFYIPQYLLEKKDSDRSLVSLQLAADIHNDDAFVWFNMAVAQAQKGDKKKAIESLQMAVDRGLKNRKYIDNEKSFDILRNEEAFQQLVAKIPSGEKS